MAMPYIDHVLNMQPQIPHVGHAINMYSQVLDINIGTLSLLYKELQPGNPDSWNSCTYRISLFGQTATQEIDVNNIKTSLSHISNFINNKELKNNREEDILFLKGFGQIAFDFVSAVFKGG